RRKRQFDDDWGERGRQRQDLIAGVRKSAALGKGRMRQALQPGGALEVELAKQIHAAATTADVEQVGANLGGAVATAACTEWRAVCEQARGRCAELLAPFEMALDVVSGSEPDVSALAVAGVPPEARDHGLARFRSAIGSAALVLSSGALIGMTGVSLTV